jgi:NADH-quinone oxidoreductase subunit L
MFFIVFHGEESEYVKTHAIKESPLVVTLPLILLAIPSALVGIFLMDAWLFGDYFKDAIVVLPQHDVLASLKDYFGTWYELALNSFFTLPVWLAFAGVALAWFMYCKRRDLPAKFANVCTRGKYILENAYGFDRLNEILFVKGSLLMGRLFWQKTDQSLIDGLMVNGSAKGIGMMAGVMRFLQTGYLYHYAFVMIFGLLVMLGWVLFA